MKDNVYIRFNLDIYVYLLKDENFMISYYTSIIFISWMALGVLAILVKENDRMDKSEKGIFYVAYIMIALSALAEWLGVQMSGDPEFPTWSLRFIKCEDYILTPAAGAVLAAQIRGRKRGIRILSVIIILNMIFQIISAFTGWMISIDENNNYSHGPLYGIYIGVYGAVLLIVIIEYIYYGLTFRKLNRMSINAIMLMVIIGVMIQEIFGSEFRTAYISLTLGVALLFIHYNEYEQIEQDDMLELQKSMLMTDALTDALSRYAYHKRLDRYSKDGIPKDLVAFVIDINGLKKVNDSFGHESGDKLIQAAADSIDKVFVKCDKFYRTGGDEFVIFTNLTKEEAEKRLASLEERTGTWTGEKGEKLSLSAGYATAEEHDGCSIEELVRIADDAMYEAKRAYYAKLGIKR